MERTKGAEEGDEKMMDQPVMHIGQGSRTTISTRRLPTCVSIQFLGYRIRRLLEFLEQGRGDCQKVDTCQCLNFASLSGTNQGQNERQTDSMGGLTYVTETGTHDGGLVAVLFVVIEDLFDRLDTRVLVAFIVLPSCLLVPVKDLYT
jgi:hypothetical protein